MRLQRLAPTRLATSPRPRGAAPDLASSRSTPTTASRQLPLVAPAKLAGGGSFAPILRRAPDCESGKAADPESLGPAFLKSKADVEKSGLAKGRVAPAVAGIPYVLYSPHCAGGKIPLTGLVDGSDLFTLRAGPFYNLVWAQQQGRSSTSLYQGWINAQLTAAPAPAPRSAPAAPKTPPAAPEKLYEFDLDPSDPNLPVKSPGFDPPKRATSVLEEYRKHLAAAAPLKKALMDAFSMDEAGAHMYAMKVYWMRNDIISAAKATGELGIPPHLLASIVTIELINRGLTMGAELDLAAVYPFDYSLGVSQLKVSAAAMVEGKIPWIESESATPEARQAAKEKVNAAYGALSTAAKRELVKKLSTPATSLPLTAGYLAKLKNRPNRFPTFAAKEMLVYGHGRESALIATEYNLGPTATAADKAQASDYGLDVARLTYGDGMRAIFGP